MTDMADMALVLPACFRKPDVSRQAQRGLSGDITARPSCVKFELFAGFHRVSTLLKCVVVRIWIQSCRILPVTGDAILRCEVRLSWQITTDDLLCAVEWSISSQAKVVGLSVSVPS